MRDLLKADTEFIWVEEQAALQKTKDIIARQPVLAFFDPKKKITLEVNASKFGVGAAIFQDDKPVAFASNSLNSAEQNYAQIEKILYAVMFGCRKFHLYLCDHIIVHTDHKPLESTAKKSLAAASSRLQHMLLQPQKYNLRTIHIPGKSIPVADTLSLKYIPAEPQDSLADDLDIHVHAIIKTLPVSDQKMQQLQQATSKGPQLQALMSVIQQGWPDEHQNCQRNISEYWNFRDELSIVDGITFKGEKILVPTALHPTMLEKVHSNHLGVKKTKQRARDVLFWSEMGTEIHNTVASCPICATKRPSNPKEPLLPHNISSCPWQKIATDIFTWDKKDYLITVDFYSRFFEIDLLTTTTSSAVIRKLSAQFA